MNKYQKALDNFWLAINCNAIPFDDVMKYDLAILQELVDKETPMKRKKIYDELLFSSYSICPKCNSKVSPICCYCENCGQKLDWSDDNE